MKKKFTIREIISEIRRSQSTKNQNQHNEHPTNASIGNDPNRLRRKNSRITIDDQMTHDKNEPKKENQLGEIHNANSDEPPRINSKSFSQINPVNSTISNVELGNNRKRIDFQSKSISMETKNRSDNRLPIYAEEVRQYLYCNRIPYWRRIGKFTGYETKLMTRGREYHNKRTQYTYKRKGDIDTFRDRFYFNYDLMIGGKIDVLRVRENSIIPVEIKRFHYSRKRPARGHVVQAIIGGLAAEYELQKPFDQIEIQYQGGLKSTISVNYELKKTTYQIVNKIRQMVYLQVMPEPTPHSKKCTNCEYWKVCQRV